MNNHSGDIPGHPPVDDLLAQKKAELIVCETIEAFIAALKPLSRDQLNTLKLDDTFCNQLSREKERQLGKMYDIKNNNHSVKMMREFREGEEKRCIKIARQTGALCGLTFGGLGGGIISWIGAFSVAQTLLTTGGCAAAGGLGGGYFAGKHEQSIWDKRKKQNDSNQGNGVNIAPAPT